MRRKKRQLTVPQLAGFVFALIAIGTGRPAYAQTAGYELCVEYSPARAGTVTPDAGTHRFGANTVVTLSAEPRPGYQFAYWIGDVSNAKTSSTTVRLDTSKIVVAVFKPAPTEETEPQISIAGGGGGGGSLVPTKGDLSSPSFSIAGGSGGGTRKVAVPVPVVVTPEPATILLLGLGTFALRRRRRR
ncbi:MAG: PEP-CTERM sorting domain-containing protein [Phycisphaerales bacterium]|nr:MAG: PEP-CTERM sorting domain-containing protein [Phycisphaerales bacterium]